MSGLPSVLCLRIDLRVPSELAGTAEQATSAALIFAQCAAQIGFPKVEAVKAVAGGHLVRIAATVDQNANRT